MVVPDAPGPCVNSLIIHMPEDSMLRYTPAVHQERGKTQTSLIQSARDYLHLYKVHLTQHGMMMACLKRWPDVWCGEQCHLYQDQLIINKDDSKSSFQETKSHLAEHSQSTTCILEAVSTTSLPTGIKTACPDIPQLGIKNLRNAGLA